MRKIWIISYMGLLLGIGVSCQEKNNSSKEIPSYVLCERDSFVITQLKRAADTLTLSVSYETENHRVVSLSLSGQKGNELLVLPSDINKLTHLKKLFLNGHGLNQFPDLTKLNQLDTLIIGGDLDSIFIYKELYHLKALKIKGGGRLQKIQFEQADYQLEQLFIFSGQLKQLDKSFSYLRALRDLRLPYNQIRDFDLSLDSLKFILLAENPIQDTVALRKRYPKVQFYFD